MNKGMGVTRGVVIFKSGVLPRLTENTILSKEVKGVREGTRKIRGLRRGHSKQRKQQVQRHLKQQGN